MATMAWEGLSQPLPGDLSLSHPFELPSLRAEGDGSSSDSTNRAEVDPSFDGIPSTSSSHSDSMSNSPSDFSLSDGPYTPTCSCCSSLAALPCLRPSGRQSYSFPSRLGAAPPPPAPLNRSASISTLPDIPSPPSSARCLPSEDARTAADPPPAICLIPGCTCGAADLASTEALPAAEPCSSPPASDLTEAREQAAIKQQEGEEEEGVCAAPSEGEGGGESEEDELLVDILPPPEPAPPKPKRSLKKANPGQGYPVQRGQRFPPSPGLLQRKSSWGSGGLLRMGVDSLFGTPIPATPPFPGSPLPGSPVPGSPLKQRAGGIPGVPKVAQSSPLRDGRDSSRCSSLTPRMLLPTVDAPGSLLKPGGSMRSKQSSPLRSQMSLPTPVLTPTADGPSSSVPSSPSSSSPCTLHLQSPTTPRQLHFPGGSSSTAALGARDSVSWDISVDLKESESEDDLSARAKTALTDVIPPVPCVSPDAGPLSPFPFPCSPLLLPRRSSQGLPPLPLYRFPFHDLLDFLSLRHLAKCARQSMPASGGWLETSAVKGLLKAQQSLLEAAFPWLCREPPPGPLRLLPTCASRGRQPRHGMDMVSLNLVQEVSAPAQDGASAPERREGGEGPQGAEGGDEGGERDPAEKSRRLEKLLRAEEEAQKQQAEKEAALRTVRAWDGRWKLKPVQAIMEQPDFEARSQLVMVCIEQVRYHVVMATSGNGGKSRRSGYAGNDRMLDEVGQIKRLGLRKKYFFMLKHGLGSESSQQWLQDARSAYHLECGEEEEDDAWEWGNVSSCPPGLDFANWLAHVGTYPHLHLPSVRDRALRAVEIFGGPMNVAQNAEEYLRVYGERSNSYLAGSSRRSSGPVGGSSCLDESSKQLIHEWIDEVQSIEDFKIWKNTVKGLLNTGDVREVASGLHSWRLREIAIFVYCRLKHSRMSRLVTLLNLKEHVPALAEGHALAHRVVELYLAEGLHPKFQAAC